MSTTEIEQFGKYELIEKIATGGMAEVYRARSRGVAGFEKILVIKKSCHILPEIESFESYLSTKLAYAVNPRQHRAGL